METSEKTEGGGEVAEKKQFVGPRAVDYVTITEVKTPAGNEVVEISYAGGFKEIMPKISFEELVTEAPTDWNALFATKMNILVRELIKVVVERDFKAVEIANLKISLENALNDSFNRATHYLWTKDDASFTPGYNVVLDRSLLEADQIIKEINNEPKKGEGA